MSKQIINIDREVCVGCGLCANTCHQSAIELVDGKAMVVREDVCDGLGRCLPVCPVGAISFVDAPSYPGIPSNIKIPRATKKPDMSACAGFKPQKIVNNSNATDDGTAPSCLSQWPVQIKLVSTSASYFEGADLLIAADCTAFSYGNFHREFIRGRVTLIGCPKLDDGDYTDKLAEIISNNSIKSITVVRMEVPCCGGIERAVQSAIANSEKDINCKIVTIGINGEIK